jgi:holo-[acyl-carrier protein] synthase
MKEAAHILGTGVDIVETSRIQDSMDRFGGRFLNRCFWPDEVAYCQRMKFPALHLAARFAAKEAISKAFGTGIGAQLGWKDMEVRKHGTGQPYLVLHGRGEELARAHGVTEVFISLSHCKEYAAAQAVIVGRSLETRE